MKGTTVFSDFLTLLEVPHTAEFSDEQFRGMPFQSMFGFSKLLQRYGIDSQGMTIADKDEISKLTPPFLAQTGAGFIIVTAIDADGVNYLTEGVEERMNRGEMEKAWNGFVLLAYPTPLSIEPHYTAHRRRLILDQLKNVVFIAGAIILLAYAFAINGLYAHWSTIAVTLLDLAGLAFTYMLVQKTSGVKSRAADAVCGVLQTGGCDSVLETKASKFFGLFSWSEVGFTYFSVSLLTLLLFPQWIGYLAICNALCLPYTVWSIWYQKFRAKAWCTLCVSVQTTLWLLFFCYLGGGWFKDALPLRIEFFALGLTYVTVLLGLNKLMPHFDKNIKVPQKDENY